MTEYGYSYIELPPHCSVERAREIRDLNVANSMLWDRWRAENAPTAEEIHKRGVVQRELAPLRHGRWAVDGNGDSWVTG